LLREESSIKLRADSCLIGVSIAIFITAMFVNGLLFLPILASNLRVQIQTFTVYAFTTSVVILAVVAVTRVFKRKF
jgi:hypothetical protein